MVEKAKQEAMAFFNRGRISCNVIFCLLKPYFPEIVFKLINLTFIPYVYIYLIVMFAYTYRDKIIPKLSDSFYLIAIVYILWSVLNGKLFKFTLGHYVNIVSGVLICLLTLSGG